MFRVARKHLLGMATRAGTSPEVCLGALAEKLQRGLDFAAAVPQLWPQIEAAVSAAARAAPPARPPPPAR